MQLLASALVCVFLAVCGLDLVHAATISVPWQLFNAPVANINARCGDTLAFQVSGFHSVTQVSNKSCTASLVKQWAEAPAPSVVSIPLTTVGTTYYLCDVGTHCTTFFMLVEVITSGPCGGASPSPAPAATSPVPAPSPKAASPVPTPSPKAASPVPSPKAASPVPPPPKAASPKRSPPKKKPAPCHAKPPPCKKHTGRK